MELVGKKVLVTGGAGFIGSELVHQLVEEQAQVVVLDNLSAGRKENLGDILDKITFIEKDLITADLEQILKEHSINCIFNLAAEPFIPDSYKKPSRFMELNTIGVLKLLLAAKKTGVERVLQYSTSEVYGTAQSVPMNENHILNPLSTYAVSKVAADRLCYTLFHEQNVPVIILRQFNVYGPRETHPYIIPILIEQLNKGNTLTLGNIKATRDFTFVSDAARAAIMLMKTDEAVGQVINSGSNMEVSVEQMARTIGKLMGHENVNITIEQSRLRPLDVERLYCDNTKIKKMTGWQPEVSFEDGLKKTIANYHANGDTWSYQ
jgi:dTDP-glucose 4,6-dehydratase